MLIAAPTYEVNCLERKTGASVSHDSDAKRINMLMVVIGLRNPGHLGI